MGFSLMVFESVFVEMKLASQPKRHGRCAKIQETGQEKEPARMVGRSSSFFIRKPAGCGFWLMSFNDIRGENG